ncbi:DUF397 domain-containing protein [Streptomyces sp. LRE541]|nr:DUF397 domain-containing protein [Streptomyces sp. LRE541]UPZ30920.1 DUF397 domain-containing protein [Streptomyces sp. LRE541]
MPELTWQKSSYSAQAANCVHVAATPGGAVHLRESDDPDTTLITTRPRLGELIRALKSSALKTPAQR